jgi:SOS response regulatory protein OraA/RecX
VTRAQSLAARGSGDLLVLDDLVRHGIDERTARTAIESLEPERVRAARLATARGVSPRTLRYLASRGFSEEALEGFVAELESGALG